jgi:hypothetical protein
METIIEFDGIRLSLCSIPNLLFVTGVGDIPQWTTRKEGKGVISIVCQTMTIFETDATRKSSNKQ